jgi:simple sugar transport system substrate-binding protein
MSQKVSLLLVALLVLGIFASLPALAQDEEIVFGVVLVGPQDDRGWSQSHYEAGEYVMEKLPNSRMVVFESLNPADAPETTLLDVVTEMVSEGAQVIFTTSDSFEEDTNTVAAQFPDVTFINITGSNVLDEENPAPPNVGNFNGQMEIPRLIAGCAAGLSTETGSIGYLGALINPETRRLAASSYLGARYCWENYRDMDPAELTFTVTWIGFWFNIPGVTLDPTEVANNFFDSGADVIISGIDTTEGIVVAGQRLAADERVFAIPYGNINGCAEAPAACLGAAYYNWGPAYLNTVQQVIDGTWEQSWDFLPPDFEDINNPDTSVIGYLDGEGLPEEVKPQLDEFVAELTAYSTDPANEGSIFLWSGPLNLQDGTELAAEGESVEILDIWFLPQLLEGMVGPSE